MEEKSLSQRPLLERIFLSKEKKEELKRLEEEKLKEKDKEPGSKAAEGNTLIWESPVSGVERVYFWVIRMMQMQRPFGLNCREGKGYILKIKDIYTSSETSSYWGNVEARKGVQQEKAMNYLATIGKMVKDLFQIVREIRIIKERLAYYDGYNKADDAGSVALKSVWIDLVEGGAKNPGSVLGLSTQVGFVILPDLFFRIHPKTAGDVDFEVNKLKETGINIKVREVLARKLKQFLEWKEKTEKELKQRDRFVLKYLRQHVNVIKLYMNWLRPYLRNIKKLQQQQPALTDVDIVTAFETSKIELEVLAVIQEYEVETYHEYRETKKFQKYFPCVLARFNYVAIPQIAYQQEGSRGAIHAGRTTMSTQGYVATKEEIDKYQQYVEGEDFELLSSLNLSIDAMKDELEGYLKEAGEIIEQEKKPEVTKEGIWMPFKSVYEGFKDLFTFKEKKEEAKGSYDEEKHIAKGVAKTNAYAVYNNFKKAHQMFTE